MVDAGVPVIPGCQKALTDVKEALEIAKGIGFPVIVKAVLGGGGKGMRVAYNEDEFENAFLMAQKESGLAFGDESMYLEHFVENPRHIEFQFLPTIMVMSFIWENATVLCREIIRKSLRNPHLP